MADLSQIEAALIKADAAGDADGARVLAGEIRRLQSAEQTKQPEPPKNPTGFDQVRASIPGRVMQGVADPAIGAVQLASKIPGVDKSESLRNQQNAALNFQGMQMPEQLQPRNIDEQVKQGEQKYQSARQATGQDGFDAARLAGNVLSPVNLAAASRIPKELSLLGKLRSGVTSGATAGALQPVTEGDYREQKQNQITVGALTGGLVPAVASGLGKVGNAASKKMTNISNQTSDKAAKIAASETASARSAAGNAAQNAYKQLEHLRELGALRSLTSEEAQVVASLEKELSEKAAEKLLPAVAAKESTSLAYKEAMGSESKRAEELAKKLLSNDEVKSQAMARVKRYGPAVLGGVVGNLLFPGLGGAVGGAATGLTLRPAIRSVANLAKNPAVQHKLLSPVAKAKLVEKLLDKNQKSIPYATALLINQLQAAE